MKQPSRRILIFAAFFALGNLIMAAILLGLGVMQGYSITEFSELISSDPGSLEGRILRQLIWIQTVTLFIVPALLFALVCYKRDLFRYLDLDSAPQLLLVFLGVVLLLTGYPIVSWSYELNSLVPLPEWAASMETNATTMLEEVLRMESFSDFLVTLTIVAILPAFGEELVFRGVLQKQFGELMKSPVAGVWISAIIFSLIHLQFEGFLPRLVLGAILGYLYLWTRNLWIPILAHFFNNGVQVALLYFAAVDMQDFDSESQVEIGFWATALSILLFVLTSVMIRKVSSYGNR